MDAFIEALTGQNGINATNIWNNIAPIAPLVITLALVKIGYRTLKGTVNQVTAPGSKKVMK